MIRAQVITRSSSVKRKLQRYSSVCNAHRKTPTLEYVRVIMVVRPEQVITAVNLQREMMPQVNPS